MGDASPIVRVTYSGGYEPDDVPALLDRACNVRGDRAAAAADVEHSHAGAQELGEPPMVPLEGATLEQLGRRAMRLRPPRRLHSVRGHGGSAALGVFRDAIRRRTRALPARSPRFAVIPNHAVAANGSRRSSASAR
jgi:hypothetical protein